MQVYLLVVLSLTYMTAQTVLITFLEQTLHSKVRCLQVHRLLLFSQVQQVFQHLALNLDNSEDFIVNSDDFVVDVSPGRVGIGTTTPTQALDVVGNILRKR